MSKDFQSINYSVSDVGKIMKASKKRHMWVFRYKSKRFTLCVYESLKSGKFKIELNKKWIYQTVGGKRSISKKVHDAKVGSMTIELMKITNNKYRLTVNNNTYESNQAQQKLFVYETFEQKKKKLQQEADKNKGEDYFGFNKGGGSKGLKGSDLFGDFKKQNGGKMKFNIGKTQKKSNDLFSFDKKSFGKKAKFGENDFFGAKSNKNKKAKKDPFAEGSDLFASKKNRKVNHDFDGFDLFGGSKKQSGGGVEKKKKMDAFADFGFGNKTKKVAKKNTGWDDMDIFGGKKQPSRLANKGRTAKNEIFGASRSKPQNPPQQAAKDADLLDFDIGINQPPSKPTNNNFGGFDWDVPAQPKKPEVKVFQFISF
jgi:hypothetical protein